MGGRRSYIDSWEVELGGEFLGLSNSRGGMMKFEYSLQNRNIPPLDTKRCEIEAAEREGNDSYKKESNSS